MSLSKFLMCIWHYSTYLRVKLSCPPFSTKMWVVQWYCKNLSYFENVMTRIKYCNIVIHQQPTITKRKIQDFFTPAENIYDYNVPSVSNRNDLKHIHAENSIEAVNAKKTRMSIVKTSGFVKTGSSLSNKIVWYYLINTDHLTNYSSFLETSKKYLIQLLKSLSAKHPIKYNLKLEATYDCPNVENSSENRAFKTKAREIFLSADIEVKIDLDFANLMSEEDVYTSKGSGFTLQSIDGLLLGVYKYTPMSGSSYIPLPNEIKKSCNQPSKLRSTVFQVGNSSETCCRQ